MFAINDPRMELNQHLKLMVTTGTKEMTFLSSTAKSAEDLAAFEADLKSLPSNYKVTMTMGFGVTAYATWVVTMINPPNKVLQTV